MKLKIKPKEIFTWKYWIHILILNSIILLILQLLYGGDMLSIKNILVSVPIVAIADIIAHTILKID